MIRTFFFISALGPQNPSNMKVLSPIWVKWPRKMKETWAPIPIVGWSSNQRWCLFQSQAANEANVVEKNVCTADL